MTLNERYRKSPEVLVNYDFADILADVGYVNLYALDDEAGNKILSRLAMDSTTVLTTKGQSGSVEANFDYEFLLSAHIKGSLYVSILLRTYDTGSGSTTNDTTIEILHVDENDVETSIGTQQAIGQRTAVGGGIDLDIYRTNLTFNVDKKFKKGEKIRVEVISTVNGNAAGDIAGFYHDPADRTSVTDQHGGTNSHLLVQIPFQLEL